MPKYTENLELRLTDMNADGDDPFDFLLDLNENNEKIDAAYGNIGVKAGSGIPTSICTRLRITKSDISVVLKWLDPSDTVVDGFHLCTWSRTILVRKAGSYPETENDGAVIITNNVRNAYNAAGFTDELPDTENEYFYRLFPVSVNSVINYAPENKFGNKVYEFILNPNDSNPATCIKYVGENADYTPGAMDYTNKAFNYGSWQNAFFMGLFRPCMLYNSTEVQSGVNMNGKVAYYLNPDNYALKEDGTASDIATTAHNMNAMVEMGQVWISEKVLENGHLHIKIASEKIDESYDCFTHIKRDGTYRDNIYRAMFDGCLVSGKVRSLSGQAVYNNVAQNTQIANAQLNGANWNIDEWNLRRLINYLLLLIGKSSDTQTVFGTGRYTGYVSTTNTGQIATGQADASKGMFHGDNNNGAVRVFHIENWWGNIWKATNGILQSGGKLYYKMCEGFSDGSTVADYQQTSVTGYIDSGVTLPVNVTQLYVKRMQLVPKLGLVPTVDAGGSSSTYYCDSIWSLNTVLGFARFGSHPAHGLSCGAFAFDVSLAVSTSGWHYGVSLFYKAS